LFRAKGCSRILRISSSVILFSVFNLLRSNGGGAPSLVIPFLVMASGLVSHCNEEFGVVCSFHLPIVVKSRPTGAPSLSPTSSY
jgi:hypothetical protein